MDKAPTQANLSRRDFLKSAGAAVAFRTTLEANPAAALARAPARVSLAPLSFEVGPGDDVILRMQAEVRRALGKPGGEGRGGGGGGFGCPVVPAVCVPPPFPPFSHQTKTPARPWPFFAAGGGGR